jgi:hypothetical protein
MANLSAITLGAGVAAAEAIEAADRNKTWD